MRLGRRYLERTAVPARPLLPAPLHAPAPDRRGPAFCGRGCPGRLLRMWDLALRDPPCVASATGRRGAKAQPRGSACLPPPAPHGRALLPHGAAPHSFTRPPAGGRRVVAIPRAHVRVCVLGRWSLLCSWAHSGQRSCRVPRWSRSSPWGETARRTGVCISSRPCGDGDLTPGCDPPGECPLSSDPARLLRPRPGPTSMRVTLDPGPSRSVRRAALRPGPGPCRQHPPLPRPHNAGRGRAGPRSRPPWVWAARPPGHDHDARSPLPGPSRQLRLPPAGPSLCQPLRALRPIEEPEKLRLFWELRGSPPGPGHVWQPHRRNELVLSP